MNSITPEQVKENERLQEEAQKFTTELTAFLNTDLGERMLDNMKRNYGDRLSFDSNSNQMAFKEGQRSIYHELKKIAELQHE